MISDKHRQSIRQTSKTKSNRISPQWKDALKQKCLERAREKRDQRIALNRQSSPTQYMSCSELDYDSNAKSSYSSNDGCMRSIIQNQLQATGVTVISSLQNDDMDSNFCTPIRSKFEDQNDDENTTMHSFNLFPDIGIHDGTYITEEELFSLMNEIEEEMHREEEQYLAHQLEMLQQEEKIEELLMEEQIESFENLHIDNDHSIPCPICHSGMLILDDATSSCGSSTKNTGAKSGIIYCQRRNQHHEREENICKLSRGVYIGHGMTLDRLKESLIQAYEQHSKFCRGVLNFDFSESNDECGLVATCTQCSIRNILIPASPIQR